SNVQYLYGDEKKREIPEPVALSKRVSKTPLELVKKAYFIESRKLWDSTYLLSKESLFFYPSFGQAMCGMVGGYLAEIDGAVERDFIKSFLSSHASKFQYVVTGGTDEDKEGAWVNRYSQTQVAPLWFIGQPDNFQGSQNCQSFVKQNGWVLADSSCVSNGRDVGFLCEVKDDSTQYVSFDMTDQLASLKNNK
ncbi:C-type lectin domain family 10 member A, partial [Biomphalaria glabrata]